jgi:hypothetical protein
MPPTACQKLGALFVVLAVLLASAAQYFGGLDTAILQLIPLVPSHWFQNAGSLLAVPLFNAAMPALRQLGLVAPALQCRASGDLDDVWVVVATNKGGSILGARITGEIAVACGLSATIGQRPSDAWPPPVDLLPTTPASIVLAIANVPDWPAYAASLARQAAAGHVRCVVITRDPFGKFRSLYTYAYEGGESGLRQVARELRNMTIQAGVHHLYERVGRATLVTLHETLVLSLARPECSRVAFEDLVSGHYDGAVSAWLDAWHVPGAARAALLAKTARHDVKRQSKHLAARDAHLVSWRMSSAQTREIEAAMRAHPQLFSLIQKQRGELRYHASTGQVLE